MKITRSGPGRITGMALRQLFRKPATINNRVGDIDLAKDYRGKLIYESSPCNGCRLCVRNCPTGALEIKNLGTKEDRDMRCYLDIGRCIFCCQCVDSCNKNCLSFSQDIDLSNMNKDDLKVEL